jgi:hypothetical protein
VHLPFTTFWNYIAEQEGTKMSPELTDDVRARKAFIEALRRTADMIFSQEEITISEKMKIGDPVVCTIVAYKENGDSLRASGQAYWSCPYFTGH